MIEYKNKQGDKAMKKEVTIVKYEQHDVDLDPIELIDDINEEIFGETDYTFVKHGKLMGADTTTEHGYDDAYDYYKFYFMSKKPEDIKFFEAFKYVREHIKDYINKEWKYNFVCKERDRRGDNPQSFELDFYKKQ